MKSAFKKKHRIRAYAYVLGLFQGETLGDDNGVCHPAREFLENVIGYTLDKVLHSDGKYHFPELWEEKTVKSHDPYSPWFNNKEERIQALENILKC